MVNIILSPLGNNKAKQSNVLLTKELRVLVLSLPLPGIPRAPVMHICGRPNNSEWFIHGKT